MMKWQQIMGGDNPTLRVREGKGGKSRVIPIHPELGTTLIYLEILPDPAGYMEGVQ